MAQSERDIKHGTAQAKVAGDDEMLRTGFHNGTPLEAGKIADAQPVDLFAPAHRLADAPPPQEHSHETIGRESSEANKDDRHSTEQQQGRQGMAEPTAGGRRLGRQA